METSLNAAWDTIKDLQDELKIHAEFRKKHKESLEKHLEDNGVSQSAKAKIALQIKSNLPAFPGEKTNNAYC